LYTGVSNNLPARVKSHNAGRGARYTRSRRPVELVYQEAAADRGAAQQREYAIRKLDARQKRALIAAALAGPK
jgi:putative endonuclease